MKLQTFIINLLFLISNYTLMACPPAPSANYKNKSKEQDTKTKIIKIMLCNGSIITYHKK